ncbi:uncharacterized protein LOC135924139 [Gordionus sp. m RMFG-2023]|uniref:uncharacterized protein LOC135924139 n=1 Tax=Gordionus sp. m RMFG-2023 TaxID=3053472 RepID=UPI0031FD5109
MTERIAVLYLNTAYKPTILLNVYVPPKLTERRIFLEHLESVISSLPKRYNNIAMRDFNTKIGHNIIYKVSKTIGNTTVYNSNDKDGKKLLQICLDNNLKIENTFSKHKPLHLISHSRAPEQTPKWHFTNINASVLKTAYNDTICSNITRIILPLPTKSLEECWSDFKNAIFHAYNNLKHSQIPKREWLSVETNLILSIKNDSSRNLELWRRIQRLLRSDRRIFLAKRAEETEMDMRNNKTHDAYKKLKHFCKPACFKKLPILTLQEGNNYIDPEKQMAIWTDFYMSAFESRIPSKIAGFQQPGLPLPHSNFSLIEINKAINKLKNNRAPGSEGIRNEHMKAALESISKYLLAIFTKIWHSGKTPDDWNKSTICNFPKKPHPSSFGDYRAITLTSTVSNLFMVLLKNRILASTKDLLLSNICAYRPNKNNNEPILALKIYLHKCFIYKLPFIFTFIDYSKAFGNVKHDALWEALKECNIGQNVIKIFKYHYNNSWARLQLDQTFSPYFKIRRGVKQGCVLSPILFNIIINKIIEETTSTMNLVDLSSNNNNINHL